MQASPLLFIIMRYAKCCKEIKGKCVVRSLVKQEI